MHLNFLNFNPQKQPARAHTSAPNHLQPKDQTIKQKYQRVAHGPPRAKGRGDTPYDTLPQRQVHRLALEADFPVRKGRPLCSSHAGARALFETAPHQYTKIRP